jgi:membrane peptidoglycan carboxypeptidase
MKQPISDDMEKNQSAQSIKDDIINVEDAILEPTERMPVIKSSSNNSSDSSSPSRESKEVSSDILDKHNGNGQHQDDESSDTQKTVSLSQLVPFTPAVTDMPTQELAFNCIDNVGTSQAQDTESAQDRELVQGTEDSKVTRSVQGIEAEPRPALAQGPGAVQGTGSMQVTIPMGPVRRSRSRALQADYRTRKGRTTRTLVPSLPAVPSVRTPATLQMLKARRHKRLLLQYLSRKHMRQNRAELQRTSNRFWGIIFTVVTAIMILFVAITGGGAYAAYSFYADTQTQYATQVLDLRNLMPGDNLKMYDRNGIFIGQDMEEGMKTEVPLKQISPWLAKATVDTEDKGFWSNPGIDVTRILQAAIDDLKSNRVIAGGSTITQQLIKNLVLTKDQNLQRKLQEVALVPDINDHYSKSDILEMYLNSNNYGETAYGPEAAAQFYFGLEDRGDKSAASQLDLAQAATLAGIPNAPSLYDPLQHPQSAFSRLQIVLDAMLNNHDITLVQKLDALSEAQQPEFFKVSTNFVNRAPHFYHFILDQLKQQYNMDDHQIARSDMKVYATLDINLQDKIQKIAQNQIASLAGFNITNAAEVLIDFHTGAILSMLGSIDYNNTAIDGQYNVALGYRQPGSSFKPYVYVAAFSNGISPGQGIADTPLSIRVSDTEVFTPQDGDGTFHGQMTIRCALQNSFNIPAVRTLQYIGIDKAMQMAQDMGVTSYTGTPGYSLVLGGLGVRLLDHTSGYGTFANGGVHVPYYGVEKVAFASKNRVDQHKLDPGTRVISPQLAYMMTNVLSDNVARSHEFGKCSMLYLFSNSQNACYAGNPGAIRPAAAKTGTTNDFRDNLTMGYTTDYVMGVWAGNNNNSPMNTVTGLTGAAPIWHGGMLAAEEGHPIRDFADPGGLQKAAVVYPDFVYSNDLFLQGKDPRQAATNPANQVFAPRGSGGIGAAWCSDFSYYGAPPPKNDKPKHDNGSNNGDRKNNDGSN